MQLNAAPENQNAAVAPLVILLDLVCVPQAARDQ
jgi:hypothetical protein